MKKSVKQKIEWLIKDECRKNGINFTKTQMRRAKKIYGSIPWTKRHLVG